MDNNFLNWLYRYPSFDSFKKLSILKVKYLQNDQNINYIHITGTNGKGSVARYLNNILTKISNNKVGLFTSPHISQVNERIVISNEVISDEDLWRIKALINSDVEQYQLCYFAILTLIALIYFQEQKVNWAIIEVGIGGLLDATNIIKSDYVVLTSLGYDHEQLLGQTLTAILQQKLGIIKTKTTKKVFVSNTIAVKFKKIIQQKVANSLIFSTLVTENYLLNNQDLAILVARTLFPSLTLETAKKIIATTSNPLRFQKLEFFDKTIYLDVAHNVMGIKALQLLLKLTAVKIDKIIFSSLTNKYPDKMLSLLREISATIVVCSNFHINSIPGEKFDLHKMILDDKTSNNLLVTGSCYFVAEVYNILRSYMALNTRIKVKGE